MDKFELEFQYLGDFSATEITHSVYLSCERCNVAWTGCWDAMECPYCGRDCLHGVDHPDNPLGLSSRAIAAREVKG